jgi:hypothetical protein
MIPKNVATKVPTDEPTQEASPTPLVAELATPTVMPTSAVIAPTITPTAAAPAAAGSYAVVLVASGATLPIHQTAGNNTLIVDKLTPDTTGIVLTGKQTTLANQKWVEIQRASGGTGWVNRNYLTEAVSSDQFCNDSAKDDLLTSLTDALATKDGAKLAALVSPVHGASVQYIRGGTIANYDTAKASWVFNSTYATPWGANPGSGALVKGTFSATVLPDLSKVFSGSYAKTCNSITLGGATYTFTWPDTYNHINYLSLYQAGPSGNDQDWRTWLIGIEYVDAKPYLFSLNYLKWEP